MRVLLIYDMAQYQFALKPLEIELEKRGHTVCRKKTDKDIDASVCIQTPSGFKHAKGETFWLQHGVSCTKNWSVPKPVRMPPDRYTANYLSPGPYWDRELPAYGDAFKKHSTGWSKTDVLVGLRNRRLEIRALLIEKYKLDPKKPIVGWFPTYMGGGHGRRQEANPEETVKHIRDDFNVLVVGHGMESGKVKKMFRAVKESVWASGMEKLEVLAGVDVAICDNSSMSYESCLFNRPMVMLDNINDPAYLHIRHSLDQPRLDAGHPAVLDNLNETVWDAYNHPYAYSHRRRYWREQVLGPADGKCCERIVDAIEREVNNREQSKQSK